MKRILATLLVVGIVAVASCAQSRTNRIYRPCSATTVQARVEVQLDGDIDLVPCSGRSVLINGVATSNTLTVSGSSRTNYFPFFSTETNLAKSPFSWNATAYTFNNTAENSDFTLTLTPSTAAGIFQVGDFLTTPTNYFQILQASGQAELATSSIITLNSPSIVAAANNFFAPTQARLASGTNASGFFGFNADQVELGDHQAINGGTRLVINDASGQFTFANTANTSQMVWQGVNLFALQRTITAGGTTGNRTINNPAGTVNFAAAASALTVTNSTVNASSIILATARTNDATCAVKNVVSGAGSFVITMTAACTAETSVGFLVLN